MPNAESRQSGALGIRHLAFGILVIAAVGCGKKGPPLAPLVIVPAAVSEVSASRLGDRVTIRFVPPEKNTDNSTPADLERIDIFALSVADAAEAPEAGAVAREGTRVGSIAMAKRRAEEPAGQAAGPRTFGETLTPEALKTWQPERPLAKAPSVKPSAATSDQLRQAAEAGPAGTARPTAPVPVRVYAVVPVSSKGRRGTSVVATVPLVPPPPAVSQPVVTYTERAISLTWVVAGDVAGYNVYSVPPTAPAEESPAPGSLLNENPLKEAKFDDPRVEFGKERCYSVTSVETVVQRRLESVLSNTACVTPVDTFPPAAPTGLAAVAGPGAMSLIWDAVNAPDLAGYLVLRGVAPGDTLQSLTPEPIKETTFSDETATPGTRYVYVILAVDTAKNASAQTARVEETAR